ncbi:MAG: hypothetical protein SWO11_20660 [Thermodesulfobacteriota bacterium]|nr:hypothetical protein [Thermodesulfobacteriota bacterium]
MWGPKGIGEERLKEKAIILSQPVNVPERLTLVTNFFITLVVAI